MSALTLLGQTKAAFASPSVCVKRIAVAFICSSALVSTAACASDVSNNTAFNPEHLGATSLSRVQGICVSEMGLSRSEPLSTVWGAATNPGLVGGENHFQGCVASLSASLKDVAATQTRLQANQDCRARGLKAESAELARCVLDTLRSPPSAPREPAVEQVSVSAPPPKGSFFTASGHEIRRREERACAAIGLNPAYGTFDACVKSIDDTFFSIDNPRN